MEIEDNADRAPSIPPEAPREQAPASDRAARANSLDLDAAAQAGVAAVNRALEDDLVPGAAGYMPVEFALYLAQRLRSDTDENIRSACEALATELVDLNPTTDERLFRYYALPAFIASLRRSGRFESALGDAPANNPDIQEACRRRVFGEANRERYEAKAASLLATVFAQTRADPWQRHENEDEWKAMRPWRQVRLTALDRARALVFARNAMMETAVAEGENVFLDAEPAERQRYTDAARIWQGMPSGSDVLTDACRAAWRNGDAETAVRSAGESVYTARRHPHSGENEAIDRALFTRFYVELTRGRLSPVLLEMLDALARTARRLA